MQAYRASLLAAALTSLCLPALAQELGPQLQDAIITGHGSTITVHRLPVNTPDGVVYRDITIQLRLDPSGGVRADAQGRGVTLAPGRRAPQPAAPMAVITPDVTVGQVTETATPPEVAAPFTAGLYRDGNGGEVRVFSQGKRLFEPFPTWALSAVSGDSVIGSAEWYSGPIRTNPHQELLNQAKITSDTYSYGVVDGSGAGHFDSGMLIGAVQTGDTLTIVSFHRHGCCTYASTPTSQVTYTRIGN